MTHHLYTFSDERSYFFDSLYDHNRLCHGSKTFSRQPNKNPAKLESMLTIIQVLRTSAVGNAWCIGPLCEVETFDISNSSSFLRFNFGIAKCEGKVSIPKWHQMAMTVCKYELHFGVDISIFRVCPVEVTTGLCDITVSFLKAPNGIFTIKKL